MPNPASESEEAFASPVPAYRILLPASYVSVPIALVANELEMNVQAGVSASALSVRHTPPPAAATQSRQPSELQAGSTASAVIRPEVVYAVPAKVRTSGKLASLGPTRLQVLAPSLGLEADLSVAQ